MKIPILKISKFRFKLKVIDQLNVPEYKGSMIRGAFGATFRSVSCAINEKTCDNCILKSQCIYFKIFETELPNLNYQYLKGVKKVPHPFVLHPPLNDSKTYKIGEYFEIGLTLFGNNSCDRATGGCRRYIASMRCPYIALRGVRAVATGNK